GIDLAAEVVAGLFGQVDLGPVPVLLVEVIDVKLDERDPAQLAYYRHELDLGILLQHAAVDELDERGGHPELAHDEVGQEIRAGVERCLTLTGKRPADVEGGGHP